MIRKTTQANALFSALGTNYNILRLTQTPEFILSPKIYKGCNCGASSTCIDQSSIYGQPGWMNLFKVSHFYTGCYVIESLLRSSLECFYNQSCINEIQRHLPSSSSMILRPLNSSLLREYLVNSTIQDLLDKLMIEEWNSSQLYDRYYNECNPKQCTYTRETRNDAIYIVTTLIGIAGGLVTLLKIVVPRVVKIVRKKKERSRSTTGKTRSKEKCNILHEEYSFSTLMFFRKKRVMCTILSSLKATYDIRREFHTLKFDCMYLEKIIQTD
jgi:hypothetical protein